MGSRGYEIFNISLILVYKRFSTSAANKYIVGIYVYMFQANKKVTLGIFKQVLFQFVPLKSFLGCKKNNFELYKYKTLTLHRCSFVFSKLTSSKTPPRSINVCWLNSLRRFKSRKAHKTITVAVGFPIYRGGNSTRFICCWLWRWFKVTLLLLTTIFVKKFE